MKHPNLTSYFSMGFTAMCETFNLTAERTWELALMEKFFRSRRQFLKLLQLGVPHGVWNTFDEFQTEFQAITGSFFLQNFHMGNTVNKSRKYLLKIHLIFTQLLSSYLIQLRRPAINDFLFIFSKIIDFFVWLCLSTNECLSI